jgi:amino acid adenylation domain-containing protein
MNDLSDAISRLSPEQRALLELRLKRKRGEAPRADAVPRRTESGPARLSFAQERLWFLDQLEPGSPLYNISAGLRLKGRLDAAALERAFAEVAHRHEILRTAFTWRGTEPVQLVAPEARIPFRMLELTDLPAEKRERRALELATEEARQPFDLQTGPLARLLLLRLAERQHLLVVSLHHIAADGGSVEVLLREIGALLSASKAGQPLPELPIQYADYAAWLREWMQGERLKAQLAYWTRQLAPPLPVLDLPADRPRPARQAFRGCRRSRLLPGVLAEDLKELSRSESATLFMTLLAAYQVLLHRVTGQNDLLIGTPVDNRNRPETEGLIGFFVNTLVLRTRVAPEAPFRDFLAQVRESVLEAHAHQDLPLEKLVEVLRPDRGASLQPLFQVAFELQGPALGGAALPGLDAELIELDTGTAKFDLTLFVRDLGSGGAGLRATLEIAEDLFEPATADRLLGHLEVLLAGLARRPETSIAELPLLSAEEREQLLYRWAGTATPYPRESGLHALFAEQAARTPEAVAVEIGEESLTYRELEEKANRLAHYLSRLGVVRGTPVAVCLERSAALVEAFLAVLKAGGAYVPLDPVHPAQRLGWILEDTRAPVLLTREREAVAFSGTRVTVVRLDAEAEAIAAGSAAPLDAGAGAEDLAYVIYTSGSTGTPKGVAVPHRAVVRLVRDTNYVQVRPDDRVAQAANASFDAATFEIWGPLLNGARMVGIGKDVALAPRELAAALREGEVTILFLTTALFNQVAHEVPDAFSGLRTLLFGGEAVDPSTVRAVLAAGPPEHLLHVYGPTESTTFSSWHPVRKVAEGARTIPIGKPIANTRLVLLDAGFRPVPVGVSGEICLGGDGLASGYLGRPDLTAEKLVPDPEGGEAGARLYRSGDLARWLPDGNVEFLGRFDHQVKVRGFRIELGEIEAVLAEDPAVGEVVVVAREEEGDRRLVAYLAPVGERALDLREVRERLRERLPEHMVPSTFMVVPMLPLNANGKVDRAALPVPDPHWPYAATSIVQPRTPFEEVVAGMFADLLGVQEVGAEDDFFDLGGHSLLATRLLSRLRQELGVSLSLREAFEQPTVSALALAVERALSGGAAEIPPLEIVARDIPQPLSFAQQRLWYLYRLEPENLLYNVPTLVHLRGRLDVDTLRRTITEIIRRHAVLRTTFSQSGAEPVQILGASWEPNLAPVDLTHLPVEERPAEVRRLAAAEARGVFDLQVGPLLRTRLLRTGVEEHVLLFTLHHIVFDGWSVGVLLREVAALYSAFAAELASPLPELPYQYVDYAAWQRRWLTGEALREPLGYWRQQLRDLVMPELPTDRPQLALPSPQGTHLTFRWPLSLVEALERLSRRERVSAFMTLLGAFQVLLHRWCGQDDISIGTPVAGRDHPEVEGLIGFFVNTLVLRTTLSGDPLFRDLLPRVRETALAAYAHQQLPFDRLVEELRPERSGGHSPLFRVFFALHQAPAEPEIPGLSLRLERIDRQTATMDLSLVLTRTGDGLEGFFEYRHEFFDDPTVMRLAGHFRNLSEAVVERPELHLSVLPLLSAPERHQLLWENQAFQRTWPVTDSLSRMFEAQTARRPDAMALVFEDRCLTYGELNRRSNRIAHRLREMGVGPEVPVGVYLERSLETVVAPLAILKAGGAYVPLDPAYPAERVAFVLEDTRTPVLLTESRFVESLPASSARILCLDLEEELFAGAPDHDLEEDAAPDQAAYVIYTSGSTGRPKGVVMSHRGALRLFTATDAWYRFGEGDIWALFFSYAFDFSVWEIFGALLTGGRLIVVPYWVSRTPAALLDLIHRERVTVLNQTPSAFVQMIAAEVASGLPKEDLTLRLIVFGGETLDFKNLEPWIDRYGDAMPLLVNMYGITETAVHSTYRPVRAEEVRAASPSFIGVPIPDLQIYLLDPRMEPVPVGATGEIYVGGDGLARCYLNRPELTAQRFVPDPFGDQPGARLYKSGDLARPAANSDIAYLGRLDYQVKIRGFRVELGEIEARLAEHPDVRKVVVMPWDRGHGDVRLIAYVAPDPRRDAPHEERIRDLRTFLREHLPEYMVPSYIVLLDELPLTPNGKIDRRALPAVNAAPPRLEEAKLKPRTPAEERLATIWQEALDVERIGVRDNFFELGGHSLVLTQVAARVRQGFGVELPLRSLFNAPTIEGMVRAIAARHVETGDPTVVAQVLDELWRLSPDEARAQLAEMA